jgi:hypothetical protein
VEGLKIISRWASSCWAYKPIPHNRPRLTENDFLMAREHDDGHIYFVGGLVAFPGNLLAHILLKDIHLTFPQGFTFYRKR